MKGFFNKLEENILLLVLAFSVFLIFIQVIMRYVFGQSLSWSEELARYLFIWYTWTGTSLAVRYKKHIRIEILKDLIHARAKLYIELLVLILWGGFSVFLGIKGVQVIKVLARSGQTSAALEIPMTFVYAAIPFGCFLMFLRLLMEAKDIVQQLKTEEA